VADVDNPSDGSGVSVRQLLAEELLCGSLVAGHRGLSNVVSWCVPVTAEDSTSSGDLSGVAGYALLPHPTEVLWASLVEGLAKSGASALLVWPGRHAEAPDLSEAARAADAVGLPLLLLGPKASFRETSRLIATKVLAQSTHVLEYGTRVHRTLGDVFARGGGLPALAHTMSQLSGATVLVIGSAGELLTSAAPSRISADSTEALAAEVQRATGVLADTVGSEPDDHEADRGGHDHAVARIVTLDVDGTKLDTIVAPVRVAGEPYGLLALVEPVHPAAEHDLSQHMVIAEQGVSLTASELLRQHSVREAQERARNDFVHALLHGRFTDKLELAARAEHYRFPLAGRFAVYVVTSPRLHPDESASRHKAHDAARLAASAVPDDRQLTLTALIGSMIVVVRELKSPAGSTSDKPGESEESRIFATRVHRAMAVRLGEDVRMAYGRPDNGAAGVARSYREARTAEALGRRVNTGPISAYTDLRVFAAIEDAAMSPAGQAFATSLLAPLQQSDGQTGNLEEVVLAYIEESGNLNATARRLHLHRNTMLYKLDRASRALQMDVRTTEAQFMVWLAYHITALSDVVGGLERELSPPI
jgi:sugar diacid utilization regulator